MHSKDENQQAATFMAYCCTAYIDMSCLACCPLHSWHTAALTTLICHALHAAGLPARDMAAAFVPHILLDDLLSTM